MKSGLSKYEGALLEEMNERFKLIMELLQPFAGYVADVKKTKAQIAKHEMKHKAEIQVLKDISKTLRNHGKRITKLESA